MRSPAALILFLSTRQHTKQNTAMKTTLRKGVATVFSPSIEKVQPKSKKNSENRQKRSAKENFEFF